jgi:hypothetical protein
MKYAGEMGLVAMIYIPSSIKFDSGIQNVVGEGEFSRAHRMEIA